MLYAWIAAVAVLVIIELATTQLVTIWFAFGAAAALVCCALNLPLHIQLIVFVTVSAVALIATRPLVKKFTKVKFDPTNADRCIGMQAKVVEEIDNSNEKGAVKVNGTVWTARSTDGTVIPEGKTAIIEKIEGVKLIVRI